MSELLTSKQVQNLLQVDRTTIYRMIKDGRLNGVKVGNQWRFPRQEIEALLSPMIPARGESLQADNTLPIHCIQTVQDVFAEIAEVGAVTTDKDGEPLTKFSNSCEFCNLIMDSPSGFQTCRGSWHQLAENHEGGPKFIPCHAGLQYARGCIEVNGEPVAMIVNGQFYVQPPNPDEPEPKRIKMKERKSLNRTGQKAPYTSR